MLDGHSPTPTSPNVTHRMNLHQDTTLSSSGLIYNYAVTQPSFPLPSLQRCPLPSPRFTGRKAELAALSKFFFAEEESLERTFLIIGMGGCGKSQIASYFVHEYVLKGNDKFNPSMVFFVDGTTIVTLDESFKAIAESKGIGNSAQDALEWLAQIDTPAFLLLDNADDPSINLRDYLPRSGKTSILINTRLQHAAFKYGSRKNSVLHLDALPETDAEDLLIRTAGLAEDDRASVRTLVKELLYYPLAIAQAAAGIPILRCTVNEYIESFRLHRTALAGGRIEGVTAMDLDSYRWTVETAYRISIRPLQDDPSAQSLLKLLGHLHHTGINEDMFQNAFTELKSYEPTVPLTQEEGLALSSVRNTLSSFLTSDGAWSVLSLRRSMRTLTSLSLVEPDGPNQYQLHPVIREALKADHPDSLPAAFLLTLAYKADGDDMLHVHHLSLHAESVLSSCNEWTLHPDIAHNLAMLCIHQDGGRRSESLLRFSIERCQRELGENSLACLRGLDALASTLRIAGQYLEAQQIYARILEQQTHILGSYHPATVRAMSSLANTLRHLGQYDIAEQMQRQVLETRISLLGPEHPDTLLSEAELAATLCDLGRYQAAEQMQKRILERRTSALGPEHPHTIRAMADLAFTLSQLHLYEEAESLQRQILEKRTTVLGPDHPDTVRAMAHLASSWHDLGRLQGADQMQRQVLEKRTSALGSDHPATIHAMDNLARTLSNLARYDEAERIQSEVLEKRYKLLGPDHPESLHAKADLASTLSYLARYDEAARMQAEVLEKLYMLLGPDHPESVAAVANVASTLSYLGRYEEAERMRRHVLEARTSLLGPDHPDTIEAMGGLASVLYSLDRDNEVEQLERMVLNKSMQTLGPAHPSTASAMASLSLTLYKIGQPEQAFSLMDQALPMLRRYLGENHPQTISYETEYAQWRKEASGEPPRDTDATPLIKSGVTGLSSSRSVPRLVLSSGSSRQNATATQLDPATSLSQHSSVNAPGLSSRRKRPLQRARLWIASLLR